MRLTELQRKMIRQTLSGIAGADARVFLFGSTECAEIADGLKLAMPWYIAQK
jgi:hypothetical protein